LRLKEAGKLGFKAAVLPASSEPAPEREPLQRLPLSHVRELMAALAAPAAAPRPGRRGAREDGEARAGPD
jgi:hypothetical protein